MFLHEQYLLYPSLTEMQEWGKGSFFCTGYYSISASIPY